MTHWDSAGEARYRSVRREVVAFLRAWLPEEAKRVYRQMIENDPENWMKHPHFSNGVIPQHALRGNGIDERVLGVDNLQTIWPELLREALTEAPSHEPVISQNHGHEHDDEY